VSRVPDRLRLAIGDDLTPDQEELRRRILESRRSDADLIAPADRDEILGGPFGPMLLSPLLGAAVQEVGSQLRFSGSLPDDVREMVILCVAGHRDSAFELYVHQRLALGAGVSEEVVDALSRGERPPRLPDAARLAVDLARALLSHERVDDATFSATLAALGPVGLFEVAILSGYYGLLADLLQLFDVGTPDRPAPRPAP
jgi:4-carboxymuconolactone decarboxylase